LPPISDVELLLVFFAFIGPYQADSNIDRSNYSDYSIFLPSTCTQNIAVTAGTEAFAARIHKWYKLHNAQTARLAGT